MSEWIPVSERLPKNDDFYHVIEKSGRVCTYVFHNNGNSEEYWKRCAVAWMPLPKPYEPQDIELVIKIPKELYQSYKGRPPMLGDAGMDMIAQAVANGTPLTPDVLANLLMEERIRGELKQDMSYSKDIINDVRCKLTVDIIDRRPCYCGAELREVWREESEDKE